MRRVCVLASYYAAVNFLFPFYLLPPWASVNNAVHHTLQSQLLSELISLWNILCINLPLLSSNNSINTAAVSAFNSFYKFRVQSQLSENLQPSYSIWSSSHAAMNTPNNNASNRSRSYISKQKSYLRRKKSLDVRTYDAHPSLHGYKYVIFPESSAAQIWDLIIIIFTCYIMFSVPYEFGMSGGFQKFNSKTLGVINVTVDLVFFGTCNLLYEVNM
jgi:hypothetical protein